MAILAQALPSLSDMPLLIIILLPFVGTEEEGKAEEREARKRAIARKAIWDQQHVWP